MATLQTLIHPPENFFKSLLHDNACLKLSYLEIDIRTFRSMHYGIRDHEDVYLFEVKEEFEVTLFSYLRIINVVYFSRISLKRN